MIKRFKIITLAPTCFGSRRNHHQGAVLCLATTTKYGFSVFVDIDIVNVMAAYQPVAQACGSQWRQELPSIHPSIHPSIQFSHVTTVSSHIFSKSHYSETFCINLRMKATLFSSVTPCSLVNVYQGLAGMCCLHL